MISYKYTLKKIWLKVQPQLLLITTLLGVILGIAIGIGLRSLKCPTDFERGTNGCKIVPDDLFYLELPGTLLINLLKMIILPLIVTSLVASLCRLSSETSGKLGGITILVFLITTIIGVILATIFALVINPGKRAAVSNSTEESNEIESRTLDTLLDILRNVCPRSIVEATFLTAQTVFTEENRTYKYYFSNGTHSWIKEVTKIVSVPSVTMINGMNALGVIAFSLTIGAMLSKMGSHGDGLKDLNDAAMDLMLSIVKLILWYSPVGIFFLLLTKMIEIDNLAELWAGLGFYIVSDIVASVVHFFIVLPILLVLLCRENPFRYYYHFLSATLTAFATSSSGATLAVSFDCAENRAGIDKRISRFILPLGATIHMDGTAIYEMTSAIFLAQLTKVPLNVGKIIVAGIMSAIAAVSVAGIPQGAIINLVMVLGAIGVPTNEIRLLYATDWLLDRVRTVLNVLGDCLVCVVLQKFLKKDFERIDKRKGMDNVSESSYSIDDKDSASEGFENLKMNTYLNHS